MTTGTSAYISWQDGEQTLYVGVPSNVLVFGGGDGASAPVTVESTSITMTGGTVNCLFGGNLGMQNTDAASTSRVTGEVSIKVSGTDAVVLNLLHGGGQYNTCVEGTATIEITGADLTQGAYGGCYINGGVHGNGLEGSRDIANGTMNTNAVVNHAVIRITDSRALLVGGGGSGSTKVGQADVTVDNCEIASLFLGGINGVTEVSNLEVTGGSQIDDLMATNRGFVGDATLEIGDATITQLRLGAATGCFSSDAGSSDGSGVTGSMQVTIGEDAVIEDAAIAPMVKRANSVYSAVLSDVSIQKEGEPLQLGVPSYSPVDGVDLAQFTVEEGETLALTGVELTVPTGTEIVNDGVIRIGERASVTAEQDSTLANHGVIYVSATGALTSAAGAVENDGTIDVYPGGATEGEITGTQPVSPYHTITATAGAGGSITPSGEVIVRDGEDAAFAIAAQKGYAITDVKVDGESVGAVESYTFAQVGEDHTIEAVFTAVHTHEYGEEWKTDEKNHWKECECGAKSEEAEHSFEWKVDKEATATEAGSKHEECTVCGYQKAAVEIPATGEPQVPGTGVDSQATLWLALLAASVAVTGAALGLRRKQAK